MPTYIRYFHIPANDILDKVKPYKKILDKQLWNNLKQHLLSPSRPVESVVLPARLIQEEPTYNHRGRGSWRHRHRNRGGRGNNN